MLKGIPDLISPELLKILHEMGHGDDLVIGDSNYPAASNARLLVRADGHGVPEVLDAILALFPLDSYVECPVALMQVVPGDPTVPAVQDSIRAVVRKHEQRGNAAIETVLRAREKGVRHPRDDGKGRIRLHDHKEGCAPLSKALGDQ